MAVNNAINAAGTGLVKHNGSGTFSGVTTTQYNTLVGAASNGITSVAPSATAGVPLISGGAAVDPSFGTCLVAGGGTGATTLTDGGILLGSGVGAITATAQPTNGQLLIGSTGADPVLASLTAGTNMTITPGAGTITLAAGGGGLSSISDLNTVVAYSDFLQTTMAITATPFQLSSMDASTSYVVGHPGICKNSAAAGYAAAYAFNAGTGILTAIGSFKVTDPLAAADTLIFGFFDAPLVANIENGVCFRILGADVNWYAVTETATDETIEDSTVDLSTNWIELKVSLNAARNSATFYVNGVLKNTIATKIPANAINLYGGIVFGSLSASWIQLDALLVKNELGAGRY